MSQSPQPRLVIPSLGGIYERLSPYMEPLLRFVAGAMLIPHGCQKLFGMFGGGGLSGTAVFMEKSGYSPGMLWAIVVGCTETFGGILLAVGLLTRPAAAAITIELIRHCSDHSTGLDRNKRTSGSLACDRPGLSHPRRRPVFDRPDNWPRILNLLRKSLPLCLERDCSAANPAGSRSADRGPGKGQTCIAATTDTPARNAAIQV